MKQTKYYRTTIIFADQYENEMVNIVLRTIHGNVRTDKIPPNKMKIMKRASKYYNRYKTGK